MKRIRLKSSERRIHTLYPRWKGVILALTAGSVALLGSIFKGAFLDTVPLFVKELTQAPLSQILAWPTLALVVLLIIVGSVGLLFAIFASQFFASALATIRGRPVID